MSGFGQVFHYAAPSPPAADGSYPKRLDLQPFLPEAPLGRTTRKVTVTCRIDDEGKLWLRVSAEGRVISEVSGDGASLSITEDL